MTKLGITFLTFVVLTSYGLNVSAISSTWANTKSHGHERKTVLQFYLHDNRTGESPTTALIAQPIEGNIFASAFGSLYMTDSPLTVNPDPNSKLVGRAQGFFGSASQEGVNYITGVTYGFIDGTYNGSSVVVFGLNSIANPVREATIVGGTGIFRMARGYVVVRTYFRDVTLGNVIIGFNVTVFHHQKAVTRT